MIHKNWGIRQINGVELIPDVQKVFPEQHEFVYTQRHLCNRYCVTIYSCESFHSTRAAFFLF